MARKRPVLNVFFPTEELRTLFKQVAAIARMSMSQRAVALIKRDIDYWQNSGEPLPLEDKEVSELLAENDPLEQEDHEQLAIRCWEKVVNGQMPTPQEITLLCGILGVLEYRQMEERLQCIASKGKITNGV